MSATLIIVCARCTVRNHTSARFCDKCGLPLGSPDLLQPAAAMANLLGDLWASGEPDWASVLALPDVKLHLYGKSSPRPGRKMGHLTVLAGSPAEARARVLTARNLLRSKHDARAQT